MTIDADIWYRAVVARDVRSDGRFVVGSRSTGTYCRPSCSTRRPRRENALFFATPADAERDGLRACFRCRPAAPPGGSVVRDAVARIEAGALNDGSIEDLSRTLQVSSRHLRRQMQTELGVSPIELAQSRRLALTRQLVEETSLPMTEIAFAGGFRSLRRFNALFSSAHRVSPTELRRQRGLREAEESIALRLEFRGPLDWDSLIAHLSSRCVPGVERADQFAYSRSVRVGARKGWVAVYPRVNQRALIAEIALALVPAVMSIVARLRRLFDLDSDVEAISRHLGSDRVLRRGVLENPGLRVPGAFDGFEVAVAAIVGARGAGRLASLFNGPFDLPYAGLSRLPFEPRVLAAADLERSKLSATRVQALRAVATAVARGELSLEPTGGTEAVRAQLAALGVEHRAIEVINTRALGDTDAGDLTPRWSPWRSYAAMHLTFMNQRQKETK